MNQNITPSVQVSLFIEVILPIILATFFMVGIVATLGKGMLWGVKKE